MAIFAIAEVSVQRYGELQLKVFGANLTASPILNQPKKLYPPHPTFILLYSPVNGRTSDQVRPILLAPAGRESSDAAPVWKHGVADCWIASASGVIQALAERKSVPSEPRHATVREKNTVRSRGSVFSGPLEGQVAAAGTIRARNRKWKCSLGDDWVYIRSRWKAKMEIPV